MELEDWYKKYVEEVPGFGICGPLTSEECICPGPHKAQEIVYLSGPMSGIEDHNFPAFEAAARDLRSQGFKVISPHETDNGDISQAWTYYMRKDVKAVAASDLVVVLPGWTNSKGAKIEVQLARDLEIPVLGVYPCLEPVKEPNILEQAMTLVCGDRNKTYGSPKNDYMCTTNMFNSWMNHKYPDGWNKLLPEDGVMFMEFVKLSRLAHFPKRDNLIDGAGYLLCYAMVLEELGKLK